MASRQPVDPRRSSAALDSPVRTFDGPLQSCAVLYGPSTPDPLAAREGSCALVYGRPCAAMHRLLRFSAALDGLLRPSTGPSRKKPRRFSSVQGGPTRSIRSETALSSPRRPDAMLWRLRRSESCAVLGRRKVSRSLEGPLSWGGLLCRRASAQSFGLWARTHRQMPLSRRNRILPGHFDPHGPLEIKLASPPRDDLLLEIRVAMPAVANGPRRTGFVDHDTRAVPRGPCIRLLVRSTLQEQ
mmetsp:Transcript_640/g.2342  ORF Transcript_640/g.2342 Transcript_640/m.2342 type:complete len:242 (+) Transcript_640:1-726(+)